MKDCKEGGGVLTDGGHNQKKENRQWSMGQGGSKNQRGNTSSLPRVKGRGKIKEKALRLKMIKGGKSSFKSQTKEKTRAGLSSQKGFKEGLYHAKKKKRRKGRGLVGGETSLDKKLGK